MDSSVSGGRAEEDGVEEYSVGAHTAMYTFYPSIRPALENRSIYSYDRRMLPVDATAEDASCSTRLSSTTFSNVSIWSVNRAAPSERVKQVQKRNTRL